MAAWVENALGRWGTLERAGRHDSAGEALEGRGTVWVVAAPAEGGRVAVRRYLRGGWMAGVLHDRYLRRGRSRAHLEARASDAARAKGIPTPRVEAGVLYPTGTLWYRADLVTAYVPDSVDLARFLFEREAPTPDCPPDEAHRAGALAEAGRLARRLAEAGIYHPDLNAKNFLVTAGPEGPAVQVLDLDRARVTARAISVAPMAARLTRSLRKFETIRGVALGERGWTAFRNATGGTS
ncbi:MAG: hypothetical protein KJP18_05225 [Gemmatimonadetes bacterium]|nr:hypothetical protein [Gemmatimonadota bacterium]